MQPLARALITRRGNRPKQRTDLSVVAVGLRAGRGISRLLARARWQGHELDRREARLDGHTAEGENRAGGSGRPHSLECERAGTSMLFGNLGAPAKARPEVPEVPGSESSKGHPQSPERSVTRTTCMASPAVSGHLPSPKKRLAPGLPVAYRSLSCGRCQNLV